jgi:hypothetical protein
MTPRGRCQVPPSPLNTFIKKSQSSVKHLYTAFPRRPGRPTQPVSSRPPLRGKEEKLLRKPPAAGGNACSGLFPEPRSPFIHASPGQGEIPIPIWSCSQSCSMQCALHHAAGRAAPGWRGGETQLGRADTDESGESPLTADAGWIQYAAALLHSELCAVQHTYTAQICRRHGLPVLH